MTQKSRPCANYQTVAARFENGFLEELVVYCLDPASPDLDDFGLMEQNYEADASGVVEDIKKGNNYFARFHGSSKLFPLELVSRHGKETLEVQDIGQAAHFKSLHNLPIFTSPEKEAWLLVFYDTYKDLTQDRLGDMVVSYVSSGAYADHGHGDPAAAAHIVFESHGAAI